MPQEQSLDIQSLDPSRLHVMATGLAAHRAVNRAQVHAMQHRTLAPQELQKGAEVMHAVPRIRVVRIRACDV